MHYPTVKSSVLQVGISLKKDTFKDLVVDAVKSNSLEFKIIKSSK